MYVCNMCFKPDASGEWQHWFCVGTVRHISLSLYLYPDGCGNFWNFARHSCWLNLDADSCIGDNNA